MRLIKFRAWDREAKKMWYPSAIRADGRNIACVNQFGVETDDLSSDPLMQFTGLLDKNGKEIYENDVVKARFDGKEIRHPVGWSVTNAQFLLITDFGTGIELKRCENIEVVGNEFESDASLP